MSVQVEFIAKTITAKGTFERGTKGTFSEKEAKELYTLTSVKSPIAKVEQKDKTKKKSEDK